MPVSRGSDVSDGLSVGVERFGLRSSDPAEMGAYLTEVYDGAIAVRQVSATNGTPVEYRHSRVSLGRVAIDQVTQRGDALFVTEELPTTVIMWPLAGRVELVDAGETTALEPGSVRLVGGDFDSFSVRLVDARVNVIAIAPDGLGGTPPDGSPIVRFTETTPSNDVVAQAWKETVSYACDTVIARPELSTPTVLGAVQRLLLGTSMAAFEHVVEEASAVRRVPDSIPLMLRRAMEFIDENAARNIGVAEIAKAVYVTPRRVQHVFKQHLGTTPTGYLREVRLQRAHEDLRKADRTSATVTATAARWRFAHTGRFAVLYRQTFGESPHETLRKAPWSG
jgi:AraC-like DNA-binding protein